MCLQSDGIGQFTGAHFQGNRRNNAQMGTVEVLDGKYEGVLKVRCYS